MSKRKTLTIGQLAQLTRRVAATTMFVAVVVVSVASASSVALRLQWIERIQITPVAIGVSLSLIALWLIFTLCFGRIYCSTVCPLGTIQDVVGVMKRTVKRTGRDYHYTEARNKLRYRLLALIIVLAVAGVSTVTMLFDPYAVVHRSLIGIVETITREEFAIGSVIGVLMSVAVVIGVSIASWRSGRLVCNTLCPVGSLLSVPAHFSLYAIDINTDVCTGCGECSRVCKCQCIDMQSHTVDSSRCVVCMDCVAECEPGAINYTRNRHRLSTPLMMRVDTPQTASTMTNNSSLTVKPTDNQNETIPPTA